MCLGIGLTLGLSSKMVARDVFKTGLWIKTVRTRDVV